MKNFVYYFLQNINRIDIPYWMKFAPPVLKQNETLQSKTFNSAKSLYYRFYDACINDRGWTTTCIDTLIYSSYRTLRVTGSAKSKTDLRILRPVKITNFWEEAKIPEHHLTDDAIRAAGNVSRMYWMWNSISAQPTVTFPPIDIVPPWPKDRAGEVSYESNFSNIDMRVIEPFPKKDQGLRKHPKYPSFEHPQKPECIPIDDTIKKQLSELRGFSFSDLPTDGYRMIFMSLFLGMIWCVLTTRRSPRSFSDRRPQIHERYNTHHIKGVQQYRYCRIRASSITVCRSPGPCQ